MPKQDWIHSGASVSRSRFSRFTKATRPHNKAKRIATIVKITLRVVPMFEREAGFEMKTA